MKKTIVLLGLIFSLTAVANESPVVTYICQPSPSTENSESIRGGIVKVISFSNGKETRIAITPPETYNLQGWQNAFAKSCERIAEEMNVLRR